MGRRLLSPLPDPEEFSGTQNLKDPTARLTLRAPPVVKPENTRSGGQIREARRLKIGGHWCALSLGASPSSRGTQDSWVLRDRLHSLINSTCNSGSLRSGTYEFLRAGGAKARSPQTGLASS